MSHPIKPNPVIKLMAAEVKMINSLFAAHGVRAKTKPKLTTEVKSGFIRYGLSIAPDEKIKKVAAVVGELSNALTQRRNRVGLPDPVLVRLSELPLALEVPHPRPEALLFSVRQYDKLKTHSMLLGNSYVNGPKVEVMSFESSPHALVAGITGAGKSVLLQNMMLSLCYATPPSELQIMLVDLKNEDMVPFEKLPHVVSFAGTRDEAIATIMNVRNEKDARIADRNRKPYRLLLWIDEIAQLALEKDVRDMLGDVASVGRSKDINLIAATQQPTQEGGIGSMMKANFPLRLVGMVAPGLSHVATGRAKAGADLLPGKGSFLRCEGPKVVRFQSFYIKESEIEGMVKLVCEKWGAKPAPTVVDLAPMVEQVQRDEIDDIADAILEMWLDGASKNAMSKHAIGKPFGGRNAEKINKAIGRLEERYQASSNPSSNPSSKGSSGPSSTALHSGKNMPQENGRRSENLLTFPTVAVGVN